VQLAETLTFQIQAGLLQFETLAETLEFQIQAGLQRFKKLAK